MSEEERRRLRFDWYNHLTTLSLLMIGGIAGFVPRDPFPDYAIISLGLIGFAGAVALGAAQRVVEGREPTGWQRVLSLERWIAGLLGIGIGVFLGGFFGPVR